MQQRLISEIFTLVANRPNSACNFLPYVPPCTPWLLRVLLDISTRASGSSAYLLTFCAFAKSLPPLLASPSTTTSAPTTHTDTPTLVTYRHYATLYFILISTSTESPLALIDLIQVFVEALDRFFPNVCELDLIFNFETLHAVLGEMIVGGVVVETGLEKVVRGVREQGKIAKRPVDGGRAGALGWGGLGRGGR